MASTQARKVWRCGPRSVLVLSLAVIGLLGFACAAPGPAGPASPRVEALLAVPAAPKHVTIGVLAEPSTRPDAPGPTQVVQPLIHSGLTVLDADGVRHPLLAEAVPTAENHLWTVSSDGRMETTWKIRAGAQWHDGVPVSADDLRFSLEVGQDPQMSAFVNQAYGSIDRVVAPDAHTLVVTWKQPYIDADALFAVPSAGLLPRHLLEEPYRADRSTIFDLPYWREGFVGTGPYEVSQWNPGSGVLLTANSQYVLGRPKIDDIEVRFIPDSNTLIANLRAGAVDVTYDVGSIDLGLQLRDQWHDGTVSFNLGQNQWIGVYPQFVDPRPAIVASDVRFRRAMVHAIDRQELVDSLAGGVSPVAHSFLNPNQPQNEEIEANVPRYELDARRAGGLLQEAGYTRGPDGSFHDVAGQPLEVGILSGPNDQVSKLMQAIADYWRQLGMTVTTDRVTPQRREDLEYVATFPSFSVWPRPNDLGGLRFLHSSATPLPSNNYRVPGAGNTSRYMDPGFDALLNGYFKTLPISERTEVLGKIVYQMADQVTAIGLYYSPSAGAFSNRLVNVSHQWPYWFVTWNARDWDVKS